MYLFNIKKLKYKKITLKLKENFFTKIKKSINLLIKKSCQLKSKLNYKNRNY